MPALSAGQEITRHSLSSSEFTCWLLPPDQSSLLMAFFPLPCLSRSLSQLPCMCLFSTCSCPWKVFTGAASGFSIPSFTSSSSSVLILESAFFFFVFFPVVVGGALRHSGKTLHALRREPCRDHLPAFFMCFFSSGYPLRLFDSLAVSKPPLLRSPTLRQIYKPPCGVLGAGGRVFKAWIRMSCVGVLFGLPSSFLLVLLCRMHATVMCRQLLIKVSARGPDHCQHRGI